jgi:hypothetical protein
MTHSHAQVEAARNEGAGNETSLFRNSYLLWDSEKAQLQFWLSPRNEMYGNVDVVRLIDANMSDGIDADNDDAKTVVKVLYDANAAPGDLSDLWTHLRCMDATAEYEASWYFDYTRGARSASCLQINDPDQMAIIEIFFKPETAMIYSFTRLQDVKAWLMRRMRAWTITKTLMSSGRIFKRPVRRDGSRGHAILRLAQSGATDMGKLIENECTTLGLKLADLCKLNLDDTDHDIHSLLYSTVSNSLGVRIGPTRDVLKQQQSQPPENDEIIMPIAAQPSAEAAATTAYGDYEEEEEEDGGDGDGNESEEVGLVGSSHIGPNSRYGRASGI